MLGPLEQLEQLTVAGMESCYGRPLHGSSDMLKEFASQCPCLRRVECVILDTGKAPADDHWQALSTVLPVGVELVLRVTGAAFFYPKACGWRLL